MTNYQKAKDMTRGYAEWVKVHHKGDKPAIRQALNDYSDSISSDYRLTEYECNLLANYVCKLHPKK